MIDIKILLTKHNIYWTDKGPNCAKGNIVVHCPFCGPDDKSQHMGINLATLHFGCWRDSSHRGKNIARLLQSLDVPYIDETNTVMSQLLDRTFFNKIIVESKTDEIITHELPTEFIPIDNSILDNAYLNYLKKRGFNNPLELCKQYDLRRCLIAGKWSARIIIPIYVDDWVTWTGRAIGNNPLRYLSPDKKESTNIKKSIFNYNELKSNPSNILVITEGPFDALTVDVLKPKVRGTCIFGLIATEEQIRLLKNVCQNFSTVIIGLDQKTLIQSMDLRKHLRNFNPVIMKLPEKDLGSMNPNEINELVNRYAN